VAVTAARAGARVKGIDLSPVLLEEAGKNAALAGVAIEFREGDAETLPYADAEFDIVLSQFGHIFAPRPHVVVKEMLRVLKPGGRIAFSTWPPHLFGGLYATLVARYVPPPPAGVASPVAWGEPDVIRERLGDKVADLVFRTEEIGFNALSPAHYRASIEVMSASAKKIVTTLAHEPARLARFRAEVEALAASFFQHNRVRNAFLMTRAVKK
ncbi:MAG: class I SAM-dependent methyltransferase, partial [Gammaproteobacteria bacterium]